ncbi:MAG: hypothetical protein QW667_07360 [Candidatus Bathyarchaeia archaeon]
MKHHIGLTIDAGLFREIEELRGREKRSTFIEHLIRLGIKVYKVESRQKALETQKRTLAGENASSMAYEKPKF